MRRNVLVAGVLAGLMLMTSAPPATAAIAETPVAAGPTGAGGGDATRAGPADVSTQSCAEQLKSQRAKATAGQTDGVCIRREPAKLTGKQRARLAKLAAGPATGSSRRNTFAAAENVAEQCVRQSTLRWIKDRFEACRHMRLVVQFSDFRTRRVTGELIFMETNFVFLQRNAGWWDYRHFLTLENSWGNVVGTTVAGQFNCFGACQTLVSDFPHQSALTGEIRSFGRFADTLPERRRGEAIGSVTYDFDRPNSIPTSGPIVVDTPIARCDSEIWDWFSWSHGCVFPDISPVFGMNSDFYPTVTRHVRMAQNSGIPGRNFPLTRATDDQITANRDRACPPWLTRPAGYTCDEYPFASTMEGAADPRGTHNGRTFSFCQIPEYPQGVTGIGWSACMVPEHENLYAGIDLGEFYISQRILIGDEFRVEID